MTEHRKNHANTLRIWHVKEPSELPIRTLSQKIREVPGLWEYACELRMGKRGQT